MKLISGGEGLLDCMQPAAHSIDCVYSDLGMDGWTAKASHKKQINSQEKVHRGQGVELPLGSY